MYKTITQEDLNKIVKHFLGKKYISISVNDVFLGYSVILGLDYIMEIYPCSDSISIYVYSFSFEENEITPQEIVGYLRCRMEDVMPGCESKKEVLKDEVAAIKFYWIS